MDYGLQLGQGPLEVVIDHHVVEFGPVGHVGGSVTEPALDHVLGVGAATPQAPLELVAGGRQDEDRVAFGQLRADLLRALPVDLENQVLASPSEVSTWARAVP